MKKVALVLAVVMVIMTVTSCAHVNVSAIAGIITGPGTYVFHNRPQVTKNDLVQLNKRGQLTNKTWLGIFGPQTFPTVEAVAKEAGITRVGSVEYLVQPGVLMLWIDWTTVVCGE